MGYAVIATLSGPARAPSGIPAEVVEGSPTWWKSKVDKSGTGIHIPEKGGVRTKNLAVHHDLPCVHREISIIETPVELLSGDGLVRGVVVWGNILMCQGLRGVYPFSGIENKHFFEQVQCCILCENRMKIDKAIRYEPSGSSVRSF